MKVIFGVCSAILFTIQLASAAEYNGKNIDGEEYSGTIYSYDTGSYYDVDVEFENDEATIHFSNGGQRTIALDNQEIEDPGSVSAYDYQSGTFFDLDVSSLE
ncbi:MAG: hypothetical protein ACHQYP_10990 [Nitrospiria bacterium]